MGVHQHASDDEPRLRLDGHACQLRHHAARGASMVARARRHGDPRLPALRLGRRERAQRYDRSFLLTGTKRNTVLELWEVERYGIDSYGDAEWVSIYGLRPSEWYARGVRLLGRTVVECTRDRLGDAIGREVAALVDRRAHSWSISLPDPATRCTGCCVTWRGLGVWDSRWIPESLPSPEPIWRLSLCPR